MRAVGRGRWTRDGNEKSFQPFAESLHPIASGNNMAADSVVDTGMHTHHFNYVFLFLSVRHALNEGFTVVEAFREDEQVYQFVWNVDSKRYSLEIDLEDNTIFLTHLYKTTIFDFPQLEVLLSELHFSLGV